MNQEEILKRIKEILRELRKVTIFDSNYESLLSELSDLFDKLEELRK